jgi:hypothetical protein
MRNLIAVAFLALAVACGGTEDDRYTVNPYMGTQDPHGGWNIRFASDAAGLQSQGGFFVNADQSYGFTYHHWSGFGLYNVDVMQLAKSGNTYTGTAQIVTGGTDSSGTYSQTVSSAPFSATLDATNANALSGSLGAATFTAERDPCWPGRYYCPPYTVQ